jgi:hypothetical protein
VHRLTGLQETAGGVCLRHLRLLISIQRRIGYCWWRVSETLSVVNKYSKEDRILLVACVWDTFGC